MPERYKDRILRHVAHDAYEPTGLHDLADELGVPEADYEDFRRAIDELSRAGQVVIGSSQTIALPPMGREVTGRFKLHERGFGFLIPDPPTAHGDLFIPAGASGGALTGDIVRAEVVHRKHRGHGGRSPYTGRIVEVLERRSTHFVGALEKRGNMFMVIADGAALADPIVVRDPGAKHAKVGQKVVVELTHFPERNYLPEGVITEVLGESGRPDVETLAICRAFNLADRFPDPALDAARQIVQRYDRDPESFGGADRTDLRDTYIITIDPPDAQDYDDALSIARTDRGTELGVHIADVAAFVEPGSALDAEAYERGNSAYLPRKVIPMLPEVLSNGVCSLQPGAARLARSCFITYDDRGRVLGARFARSLIRSAHRLTYLEAQHLIDGDHEAAREHARYEAPYTDRLVDTLRQMDALARAIRKRRLDEGMIVLDLPEVELLYDERGHVTDARPEDDAFTHRIIEMFMVEANEAVARLFADLNVPLIRRVHPEPGAQDITELRTFARVAGYNIPDKPTRKELQHLLDRVRGKPAARAVHFAVLKTLTKAEYSPALIGHFALASEHYTHFTSPIRRYPDLAVHRAIDVLADHLGKWDHVPRKPAQRKKLANRLRSDQRLPDESALQKLGRHCSTTERNAETAERELRDLLVMQLLARHIGDDFDGTVTGVTGFGVFVQIDKYLVEGMIRPADLPGAPAETWKLNKQTGSMTAQRSGRAITIGDQFRIRIAKADLTRREMDLLIVDDGPAKTPGVVRKRRKLHANAPADRKKSPAKRGKHPGRKKTAARNKRRGKR